MMSLQQRAFEETLRVCASIVGNHLLRYEQILLVGHDIRVTQNTPLQQRKDIWHLKRHLGLAKFKRDARLPWTCPTA